LRTPVFACRVWSVLLRRNWCAIQNASAPIQKWRGKASPIPSRWLAWTSQTSASAGARLPDQSIHLFFILSKTMNLFENKVVLITGGGAGIGLAAAAKFVAGGAQVIITGRRQAALAQSAQTVPGIDHLVADAGKPGDAVRTIDEVIRRHGRLDVLVNNAGAGAILPLAEAGAEQINDIFSVNVIGPSLLAIAALPYLKQSAGNIINVSSTFGHKAAAALSHYAASKAALEHLTRC